MKGVAVVLGVYLMRDERSVLRVGTLTRDAGRATAFIPDEAYLRDDARPILSLGWHVPGDPAASRARLASRGDKIGLYGYLPPWFQGLLPEGALRDLVNAEMGPGEHDPFDVLMRLGADLPGAVFVVPDNQDVPSSVGPIVWDRIAGFRTPLPQGVVKFSLAGVQLKLAAEARGERLTVSGRSARGGVIIKLASDRYEGLPEAEYAAMSLAAAIGVRVAPCRLVPVETIEGIPGELIAGHNALAVDRFDRTADGGRMHIEDAAQILSVWGEQKYTAANTETILNMIARFSTDWREDVMEGIRRVVADILLGNGDSHLKNWSFVFPAAGEIRLSPAYDMVPTIFFQPQDELALRFAGTSRAFEAVTMQRFLKAARFLGIGATRMRRHVVTTVLAAVDNWPRLLPDLPLTPARRDLLWDRLLSLPLTREVLGEARPGMARP